MSFPSTPINGQQATVNSVIYVYSSSKSAWNKLATTGNTITADSLILTSGTSSTSTNTGALVVDGGLGITNDIVAGGAIIPGIDNTGFVGNTAYTWANGEFTNLTVTGTLSVRAAIDLADNDILRLGSGDDWEFFHNGTNNYMDLNVGDFIIRDGTASRITIERTTGDILPAANVAQNIGSSSQWWNIFYGKSVQAQYADLAENYVPDFEYAPGTVVVIGGEQEITVTNKSHDRRVAGVISTAPAYLMNAVSVGLPVALTGKAPCFVQGPVQKGDLLVTSNQPGVAKVLDDEKFMPGCIFGKSLESIGNNEIRLISVLVGRF